MALAHIGYRTYFPQIHPRKRSPPITVYMYYENKNGPELALEQ